MQKIEFTISILWIIPFIHNTIYLTCRGTVKKIKEEKTAPFPTTVAKLLKIFAKNQTFVLSFQVFFENNLIEQSNKIALLRNSVFSILL